MYISEYADVNQLLEDLLARMKGVLGEKLVGLYLYGSLVLGDFDHEISDIDMLAATAGDVTEDEAAALERMHEEFVREYEEWDNRIEVHYLSLEGLGTFRSKASKMGNISPGEPFHVIEAGKEWLMNWYIVREKGVVLYGPPPETIIPPISNEEFVQAAVEHNKGWREWIERTRHSRPAQGYAILTACRDLYTYRNGERATKKQAARWAERELPEWAWLIESALRWRAEARSEEEVDHEATYPLAERFVRFVSEQVDAGGG